MSNLVKPSRRSLFAGAASIIAAPAIIRVADLMRIKPQPIVISYDITRVPIYLNEAIAWGDKLMWANLSRLQFYPPNPALAQEDLSESSQSSLSV